MRRQVLSFSRVSELKVLGAGSAIGLGQVVSRKTGVFQALASY